MLLANTLTKYVVQGRRPLREALVKELDITQEHISEGRLIMRTYLYRVVCNCTVFIKTSCPGDIYDS